MDLNEVGRDNVDWIFVVIIGPVPMCCKQNNELPGFI
jgi:hypothetical protein